MYQVVLIEAGATVDKCDILGRTPFHYACRSGEKDLIELFLNHKANALHSDWYKRTALHSAVGGMNLRAIKLLIRNPDIVVDAKDSLGDTPLSMACRLNDVKMAELLMEGNAMPSKDCVRKCLQHNSHAVLRLIAQSYSRVPLSTSNFSDRDPVLHQLCRGSFQPDLMEALLDNGFPIGLRCRSRGDTPLSAALTVRNFDAAKLLILRGASCTTPGHRQQCFHLLIGRRRESESEEKLRYEMMKIMANRGCYVDSEDNFGETALTVAVKLGRWQDSHFLLDIGANPMAGAKSTSLLHSLAYIRQSREEYRTLILRLVDCGCSLSEQDQSGKTPLLAALGYGNFIAAKLFLSKGASLNALNLNGKAVLGHFAIGLWKLPNMVLIPPPNLSLAIDFLEEMSQRGIPINSTNEESLNLLHLIVKVQLSAYIFPTLSWILRHGGDASLVYSTAKTPLHYFLENRDIFENNQSHKNQRHGSGSLMDVFPEQKGDTPASSEEYETVFDQLFRGYVESRLTTTRSDPPIHVLVKTFFREQCRSFPDYLLKRLIDLGEDLSSVNGNGETPAALGLRILSEVGSKDSVKEALRVLKLLVPSDTTAVVLEPSQGAKIICELFKKLHEHTEVINTLLELPLSKIQFEAALGIINNSSALKLLLDQGLNPNIPNSDGDTPLHKQISWKFDLPSEVDSCGDPKAARTDHFRQERVRVLLKAGADPNMRNHKGLTPLQVLRLPESSTFRHPWRYPEGTLSADFHYVIAVLLEYGAND